MCGRLRLRNGGDPRIPRPVAAAFLAALSVLVARSPLSPADEPARVLELRVVHTRTREPLAGVSLRNWSFGELSSEDGEPTGEQGRSRIPIPDADLKSFTIHAGKPGFVPKSVTWWRRGEGVPGSGDADIRSAGIPSEYTLEMEPAASMGGVVLDEDGRGVRGANLYLTVLGGKPFGERVDVLEHPVKTDASGRWRCEVLPARLEGMQIRLVHPGYVSRTERLQDASSRENLRLHSYTTVLERGAGGRFVLDRVPAGKGRISRKVRLDASGRSGMTVSSHDVSVVIRSGETARTVIGGGGRAVIGRAVKAPESKGEVDWSSGHVSLRLEKESDPRASREYAAPMAPDRSFRLEDVAAGLYKLELSVYVSRFQQRGTPAKVGTLFRELEVAEAPDGPNGSPLDIGVLQVKIHKTPAVGDPAPPFSIETLDRRPLRLEDYRGKLVLLDFWATSCGPCIQGLPQLKELYETFGRDERFVMIGLSLDSSVEAPKRFAREHGLEWIQGFIGRGDDSTVLADYCVSAIPRLLLIGSEGRVLATELHGARTLSAVARGLAELRKKQPPDDE